MNQGQDLKGDVPHMLVLKVKARPAQCHLETVAISIVSRSIALGRLVIRGQLDSSNKSFITSELIMFRRRNMTTFSKTAIALLAHLCEQRVTIRYIIGGDLIEHCIA